MKDTRKIKSLVKQILLDHPAARESDDLLYLYLIEILNPECYAEVKKVCNNKLLPKRHSVERARRWVQAHIEGTQAKAKVEAWRELHEQEYRKEYGRA